MTPPEKAAALVDKMYFSRRYSEGEDYIPEQSFKHAIQCALITVDEMFEEIDIHGSFESRIFWQQVKKEINKL